MGTREGEVSILNVRISSPRLGNRKRKKQASAVLFLGDKKYFLNYFPLSFASLNISFPRREARLIKVTREHDFLAWIFLLLSYLAKKYD